MDMLHRKQHLSKQVHNLIFFKKIVGSFIKFYFLTQIASISVIHDDAELTSNSFINFLKTNDARVVKNFKDFCFSKSLLSLFQVHLRNVYFFNYCIRLKLSFNLGLTPSDLHCTRKAFPKEPLPNKLIFVYVSGVLSFSIT